MKRKSNLLVIPRLKIETHPAHQTHTAPGRLFAGDVVEVLEKLDGFRRFLTPQKYAFCP